jgi:hypothetical protein
MLSKQVCYLTLFSGVALLLCGCPRPLAPAVSVDQDTIVAVRRALEAGADSSGGGEVALADPTGFATLAGKFTINGAAPPNPPLTVNKDVAVCAPGGAQVLDKVVEIGPGNGIKNVLIFVSSKIPSDNPAWIHESYESERNAEVIFDQKNCVFLSRLGVMWSTQHMKILNSDSVAHNTNLASNRGAKRQDTLIPANAAAPYEPGGASPQPFPVSCAIHPWMKASMMVCDHPLFAVTTDDGGFEIANVPAGVELEFRVWQEKPTFIQNVSVNGEGEKWSRGRFKLTLAPDERRELNVSVDAAVFQ